MVFKSLLLALIKRLFIETKKDPTSVWKDEEVLARSTRERHSRQKEQHIRRLRGVHQQCRLGALGVGGRLRGTGVLGVLYTGGCLCRVRHLF